MDDDVFSRTIKVKKVEEFDWQYTHEYWDGANRLKKVPVDIKDIQAIYINPKWKQSQVGDCLTFDKRKKKKGDKEKKDQGAAEEKPPQKKPAVFTIEPNDNKNFKKKPADEDSESSDYEDKRGDEGGVTIDDFRKLRIPEAVMKDGMLFIWVEKEYISAIISHLEQMNFFYVENVCYVMIDRIMEKEVRNFATIDATPAMILEDFTYLKKSHKSLLMFRRISKDGKLELRHQRTGDVVFDWKDPENPQGKPDFYMYKLIETLLPKAMPNTQARRKDARGFYKSNLRFMDEKDHPACQLKMLELWAHSDKNRKGWMKVIGML